MSCEICVTSTPNYKLIYFDVPARAEVTRLVFHAAGVSFEDYRVSDEEWPSLKPEMPFGLVPVLEVEIDGEKRQLGESHAIARYVSTKFCLVGNNAWDSALCDQYVDALRDVLDAYCDWFYGSQKGKSEEEIEEAKKKLYETTAPPLFDRLTTVLEKNPAGWLVGDTLTWADLYLAYIVETLDARVPGSVSGKYVELFAHMKKVHEVPGVKAYLEKRKPL